MSEILGSLYWVEQIAEIKAIISLPEGSFNAFGAIVQPSLCVFRKLNIGETLNMSSRIFLAEIENLGYDATGRSKSGSEVSLAIEEFHNEVGW